MKMNAWLWQHKSLSRGHPERSRPTTGGSWTAPGEARSNRRKRVCYLVVLLLALPLRLPAQFNCRTNHGALEITGYTGPGGSVVIPERIHGLPVTRIAGTIVDGWIEGADWEDGWEVAISDGAFFGYLKDSTLTSITIPNTVTSIGAGAFGFCSRLSSVTIPDSVTNIETMAFEYCGLTNATLGSGLTRIEDGLFYSCANLEQVTLGNRVSRIGSSAFDRCVRLSRITLPSSVGHIGAEAFRRCDTLSGVYFRGDAPTLGCSLFYQGGPTVIYYLPGSANWASTFDGRPTAPWFLPYPLMIATGLSLGAQAGGFGFRISWATNATVVVEACSDLAGSGWSPVSTNTLAAGWSDFRDASFRELPCRYYRVRCR